MKDDRSELIRAISLAIAAQDPLEPWDVVANYDDHYWDDIGESIGAAVARARTERGVRRILRRALRPLASLDRRDPYVADRVAPAAAQIWRYKKER